MDTATLRWIIIVIGLIILGAIFLFGNPDKKQKPSASRRKPLADASPRLEPTLDELEYSETLELTAQGELPIEEPAEASGVSKDAVAGSQLDHRRREPELRAVAEPPKTPPRPRKPAGPPPEKIVTLFILAAEQQLIHGTELLQLALKTDMKLGDMEIFHRQADGSDTPVFSMANAVKPGYFDKDAWNTFESKGLVMFMTLPGPMLALDAWDAMLATAKRVTEVLGAHLLDDGQQPLTRQKEGQIREEMRQFDRERARKALL
jgi:cell division protein ZipA